MIACITAIALVVLIVIAVFIVSCGYQPSGPPSSRPRPRPGSKENP